MLVDALAQLGIDHGGIAAFEDHGDGFALRFARARADDAAVVDHGGETLRFGVGNVGADVGPRLAVEAALPHVGAGGGTGDETGGEQEGVLVVDHHPTLSRTHGDGDAGVDGQGAQTAHCDAVAQASGATQVVGAGIGGDVFDTLLHGAENGLPRVGVRGRLGVLPLEREFVFINGLPIDCGYRIGRREDGALTGAGALRVCAGAFGQVGNPHSIGAGDGGVAGVEQDVDGVLTGLVGRAHEGKFRIVAVGAVGKRPGVGGAGEIDGFDANGIAVADGDTTGDATRNGGRVLQQHVLVHVREAAGVGGFDAVARAQTALFEGHGAMGAFLLHEGAIERAQFVDVGLVPAFEAYVDLTRVGAGTEEAHRVGTVESQGFVADVVGVLARAVAAVGESEVDVELALRLIRFDRVAPVEISVGIAVECVVLEGSLLPGVGELGRAGGREGDFAVAFDLYILDFHLQFQGRLVGDGEGRGVVVAGGVDFEGG